MVCTFLFLILWLITQEIPFPHENLGQLNKVYVTRLACKDPHVINQRRPASPGREENRVQLGVSALVCARGSS